MTSAPVIQSCTGKNPLKVQDTQVHFSVTKYEKFIAGVSDFTLHLAWRNHYLASFGVVSNKDSHHYLKRLLKFPSAF